MAGWPVVQGRQYGGEVPGKPQAILVKQGLHASGVFRGDNEAHMMPPVQPPGDFGVLVCRGIGMLLACQCDDDTAIVLLMLRQPVWTICRGRLDPGPLAPEIDAGGNLNQLHDISTTHPGSRSEKVKTAIVVTLEELNVGCSLLQAKSANDPSTQFLQGFLVLGTTQHCASGSNTSFVKHIQWRTPIAVNLGKDDLAIHHQCIDVIDLARNIALQQVEGLPVTKRVHTLPELFWGIDPGNANGRGFRPRFEHPWRRDPRQVLAKLIVVQDVNEVGHSNAMLLSFEA